ncbi:DUF1905 domain-containing protein [Catenuloplanes atrovinosus]|uniref:DUF1905 domain-containing protein n=1 Tax=Catenuloplanes atrovinosus TaxID=137266 RepID=A0AAE3YRU8_9ACTN|nr:DUF1905 domain-containing protein [Catenuloplanes atrovinosus]MDR7277501.1 hypothetical protein [Catenuloplanes atrovinosus]
MDLEFSGELWFWRGPAPWHFVTVPEDACAVLREVAPVVSYGWGMIPATVHIGGTSWDTALWPKDGRYLVPIRTATRRAEGLEIGDPVALRLEVACEPPLR